MMYTLARIKTVALKDAVKSLAYSGHCGSAHPSLIRATADKTTCIAKMAAQCHASQILAVEWGVPVFNALFVSNI